ncbi:hypothetical protein AVEN_96915-1 [Araneus ventricosus]|uniref:RNase H type-1 domain-containing protein n=1 Tax=Araneus ventricosus TaxID=182803 RepID=A0A4Y2AWJ0_ARAVE|nr:hypothetical protein AVEN_96915-1 [Araneus ventricosus]
MRVSGGVTSPHKKGSTSGEFAKSRILHESSNNTQPPARRHFFSPEVYTDGSKIDDQTGSDFCAIANETITKTWKAKFSPDNTVFQAEMLALKAAIQRAITANEEVNIFSDRESSLQDLKSFYVKSKITQEAQMILLENARIGLGWVKSHIGVKGNEIADTFARRQPRMEFQPAFHSQKVS